MDVKPLLLVLYLMITRLQRSNCGAATISGANDAGAVSFVFNGFNRANLTTDGAALVMGNGLLQLTNNIQLQKGHAFHHVPISFKRAAGDPYPRLQSFSTTFAFAIVPLDWQSGQHGMAFVVSPTPHFNYDPEGRYLGIFNTTNNGDASNHIFAVELDLIKNLEFKDINDNHVGIDVNGLRSFNASRAGYYATEADGGQQEKLTNLTLVSGEPMQLWVDYDATTMLVEVTLAPLNVSGIRPKRPLLSTRISNLSDVFLDRMYVGFSGAAGKDGPVAQYVLGWSFLLGDGPTEPLDLNKLPKLPKGQSPKKLPTLLTILLPIATAIVLLLAITGAWLVWQKKKMFEEVLEDWEIDLYGPHRFLYRDLYMATKGFSEKELLGSGGFGTVYKGVMPSSRAEVAVKRVSHDSRQGIREFLAEIDSIGRLRHRNLVQLLGYCRRKGELFLVYDYMPNGSLDALLFEDSKNDPEPRPCTLDWDRRFHIIKGVGAGLRYLHEEWEKLVIHRDVKSSNVLLDRDFNGRLGDFGLARLYDRGTLPKTTHVVGTMGYIAPDLTRLGKATEATDVFAFGVFLLEVVCGRRPIEPGTAWEEMVLVDWVLSTWMKGGKLVDCLDKRIRVVEDNRAAEVELVLKLGLLCSQDQPESRPTMRQVMQILDGDLQLPELSLDNWSGSVPLATKNSHFDDFMTRSSATVSVVTAVSDASDYLL